MTAHTTATAAVGAHPRRWLALALLGIAQFMLILDVTVVAVALPQMSIDLGLSREAGPGWSPPTRWPSAA